MKTTEKMKQEIVATGRNGRIIVTESYLIGTNLRRTLVVFPEGSAEVRFSRNPFCKY